MSISKVKKEKIVKELKENFLNQKSVFLVDYKGLTANEIIEIKNELRGVNSIFKVAKKTLIKIVFENFEKEKFKEQVGLIFGYKDEVAPTKVIYKFSKVNNLKILGGYLEGSFIPPEEVIKLAKLSSREELLEKLIFIMKSPISQFITVLNGNTRKLVSILNLIKEIKN